MYFKSPDSEISHIKCVCLSRSPEKKDIFAPNIVYVAKT